jgi:hypothetical protein
MTLLQKQSRAMSLVEAGTNVLIGFLLATLSQMAIFPKFGLVVSFGDHLLIGIIFTAVSIARSFTLRRVFEGLRMRIGNHRDARPMASSAQSSDARRA